MFFGICSAALFLPLKLSANVTKYSAYLQTCASLQTGACLITCAPLLTFACLLTGELHSESVSLALFISICLFKNAQPETRDPSTKDPNRQRSSNSGDERYAYAKVHALRVRAPRLLCLQIAERGFDPRTFGVMSPTR